MGRSFGTAWIASLIVGSLCAWVPSHAQGSEETPLEAPPQEAAPSGEGPASQQTPREELPPPGPSWAGYVRPGGPILIDGYTMSEVDLRIRRARIGLFASTGAFAAGLALVVGGVTQCENETGTDNITCNRAGTGLLGAGYPLFIGGVVGMITTGAILGVRNRKKRELERRIRNLTQRRLRWDVISSRFVF